MNMLKNMNDALQFIEEHLEDDIDFEKMALLAGVSEYHFRKLFSYLSGMSLSAYIRNRRLSKAVVDLQQGNERVVDIAVKYGYDSADGFSRAFREWSGINPSDVMDSTVFKVFPRLTFQLTLQGGMNMEYRIVEKEAFKLVGIKKRVPIVFEGQNPEIMKMAHSITEEQRERLQQMRNTDVKAVVNASFHFDDGRLEEQGELDHLIGSITTLEQGFEEFDVLKVPTGTWGIFSTEGPFPQALQEMWANIFSEWLPSSNYGLVEGPEISFNGDFADPMNVYSEVWIPVKKID